MCQELAKALVKDVKELQQSIAEMEGDRAGDVAFQKASKELGM